MTKKAKKIFKIILSIVLLFIIFIVIEVIIRSNVSDKTIKAFTDRGVFECKIDNTEYYKVIKKYDYEDTSCIIDNNDDKLIGTTGDIYLVNNDPFGTFTTKYLSSKLWFGHCGIVYTDDASELVEVVGNQNIKNNIVKKYINDWYDSQAKDFSVLRVKSISKEDKTELNKWLDSKMGCKYNYFIFAHLKNSFYCLDLISRAYESIDKDIDGKFNITLGSSLISNDNTYMIYYRKKLSDASYKVYYLCEE